MLAAIKINFSSDVGFGEVFALFALGVSVIALAVPWWKGRRADLEVRSEEYGGGYRFVVKNHGPARARDVEVGFSDDGQAVKLTLTGMGHRTTTPLLHPGEEHHMNYPLNYGQEAPEKVVVTWRDKRLGLQRQEFYPSMRQL